jgi:hypothetical protein
MKFQFWVSRTTSVAAVMAVLSACGGSSAAKTTSTATTSAAPQSVAPSSTTAVAPSNSAARAYVSGLVPGYKNELKAKGADLFGTISVRCAATGGPETECLVQIPYRRLGTCAIAKGSVFVEQASGGLRKANRPTNGQLDLFREVCYIGPNGQPVPSNPTQNTTSNSAATITTTTAQTAASKTTAPARDSRPCRR